MPDAPVTRQSIGKPLVWGEAALDQLTTFGPADLAAVAAWVAQHGDAVVRQAYAAETWEPA